MCRVLLGFTLAGLFASGSALAEEGIWLKDDRAGCKVWDAAPSPGETVKWSGMCKAGKATGKGTVDWFQGGRLVQRVEGAYAAGKLADGAGKVTQFENGAPSFIYEGSFLDGELDGVGVVTYPNGERHVGPFAKGERHGTFTQTYPDGTQIEGDYLHNRPSPALQAKIAARHSARASHAHAATSDENGGLMHGIPVDRFKEACQRGGPGSSTACGLYQWATRCGGGSPVDCDSLGKAYVSGIISPKDQLIAKRLLKAACAQGSDAGRCTGYGVILASGTGGFSRDETAADELLHRSCSLDADQCAVIGVIYRSGRGVRQDQAKSKAYLKAGCDRGSASACRSLGQR